MGVAAKFNCYIECRSIEAREEVHAMLVGGKTINGTLADYYGEPCNIEITLISSGGAEIELEVFSTRSQNTDFQHELLIKFLREKAAGLIEIFSSSGWVETEGEYIDFREEETI